MVDLGEPLDAALAVLTDEVPSYLDFAGTITLADGEHKGEHYDPTTHPAQHALMAALDEGFRRVVAVKPVQDGGSLACLVPLLRRAVRQHQSVALCFPTMDAAKDAWTTKVRPTLLAYGGQEPEAGGGSRGGAARVVQLPGGGSFLLRQAGGRGESGQASVTCDALEVDEADDWPDRHRIELISKRLSRSADPLFLAVSTVKRDRGSIILGMYGEADATGSRLHYPCPHCGAFQSLEWEHLDTAAGVYRCAHCPATWSDADRLGALRHWRRVDARPGASVLSLLWTALESPFPLLVGGKRHPILAGLSLEYRAAKAAADLGEHGLMRTLYRDRLARGYQGDEDLAAARSVHASVVVHRSARSEYDRGTAPWPGVVSVGVDMQEKEAWWLALVTDGERTAVIDAGVEYLCGKYDTPTPQQRRDTLDRVKARAEAGWPAPDGTILRAIVAGVDVGGRGWLDQVDGWLRSTGWRWYAMRGDPRKDRGDGAARGMAAGWWELFRRDDGRRLVLANGDTIKARILDGLSCAPESPAAMLIPRGIGGDDPIARHLCAESRQMTGKGPLWIKRGRNDLLDACVYANALARLAQHRLSTRPADAGPSIESIGA